MVIKSITREEIAAIHNFIREARFDLNAMNYNSDELVICLPNWLQQLLRAYPMINYVDFETARVLDDSRYFDIQVQSHFKDEVVMFFKDYHINPSFFTPAIHVINFESAETRKEQ
ncbi:hypothetical protein D3C85_1209370 [compost metagenome]